MLNISFFIIAFLSTSWFIYCLKNLSFSPFLPETAYKNILTIVLPIIAMWVIFCIIKNYIQSKLNNQYLLFYLEQTKKNSETLLAIYSSLNEQKKEFNNNFILTQSETLISDINETLSEIIKRSNSISSSQMEHLLTRTSNGERWLIAKTFIEINNFQTGFSEHLLQKAQKDPLLKGSILEFQSRYQDIHAKLKTYDTHNILFSTIEYGPLGKVYDVLEDIFSSLSKEKNSQKPTTQIKTTTKVAEAKTSDVKEFPSFLTSENYLKQVKAPKNETPSASEPINIEEGLKAIRQELISETPKTTQTITTFASTQSALRNIKPTIQKSKVISVDELEKEINASPENNYDTSISPLGDWLDEKKN